MTVLYVALVIGLGLVVVWARALGSTRRPAQTARKAAANTNRNRVNSTAALPTAQAVQDYAVNVALADAPLLALRQEKITEADFALFYRYQLNDWSGRPFDPTSLLRLSTWWVNADKSVLFLALGGGAFEIPEMHALVCFGAKVHIECGGGGERANVFETREHGTNITVFVSRIHIPPELAPRRDAVLALVAQAFAATLGAGTPGATGQLTVRFRGLPT